MNEILCKRIYDAPEPGDGFRVLVDRLWPRGIKKDAAELDLWAKKIAPTGELRKWFGHDPEKFREFCDRYCQELDENPDAPEYAAGCSAARHSFVKISPCCMRRRIRPATMRWRSGAGCRTVFLHSGNKVDGSAPGYHRRLSLCELTPWESVRYIHI